MAKKRKVSSRGDDVGNDFISDVGRVRKTIRTFEDVADSEDEFHVNRDEVLLSEGPDAKRRRRWQEQEQSLQPSDEEVLGYSDSQESEEEDDEDDEAGHLDVAGSSPDGDADEADEEDGDRMWAMSKENMYGADVIETEEQALEEEAEAARLQKRQLEVMEAADYGFDENEWQTNVKDGTKREEVVVTEVLPQLQVSDDMPLPERLKLLKSRYPEFEPLSKELLDLTAAEKSIGFEISASPADTSRRQRPGLLVKRQAASAYMGALIMYFALLSSTASSGATVALPMPANDLRDHPVMETLVKCRETWLKIKDLRLEDQRRPPKPAVEETIAVPNGTAVTEQKATKTKKSRTQRHAEAVKAVDDARKAERMRRTEANLADLDNLISTQSQNRGARIKARADGDGVDAGEEAPLTAQEAVQKAQRKKGLRFYTSQIAQKANKRGAAGRGAGGDDDIPYRERLKDRQARLIAEAEKRGRKPARGDEALGGDSDEEDNVRARAIREEADNSDDEYYDLVASRAAKRKTEKAALAEAQKQAAMQGGRLVEEETTGPDGKRKISYAIEKNRGLTPHRKKDVRNPRVKKRKKFDEKKKKLATIKPVYRGGEGRGGYGGELTGIKKGLVKSTKL